MTNLKSILMKCPLLLIGCFLFFFSLACFAQAKSHDISVGEFNKIIIEGPFNINLSNSKCFVKAVSKEDVFDWLVVSNIDGTLKISIDEKKKKSWSSLWGNTIAVDLFIGCSAVSEINLKGVGKISTINTLKSNELLININGVNRSELDIDAKKIQLTVSGIGEYLFKGNTDNIFIDFSGIGNFNSSLLNAKSLTMNGSGIGNCTVRASEEIWINSSGIGNITYLGSPQKRQINKSGIGSISAQ